MRRPTITELNEAVRKYNHSFFLDFIVDRYYRRRESVVELASMLNIDESAFRLAMDYADLPVRERDQERR
jgi:uncharacterized protein (DUF1778 family)